MDDALRTTKRCEKCGQQMPAGSLAYEVRIEVWADFDGVLPEAETYQDARAQMQALVREMTARSRRVSLPTSFTLLNVVWSWSFTVIVEAVPTTWLFVRM